jgi:hypothetical protein
MKQQETTSEFDHAVLTKADCWVPACGGTEKPFSVNGTMYLYCFNAATHEHAYMNLGTDMIELDPPF